MFKIVRIGGKDYRLEYSIAASLYSDCTKRVTEFMVRAFGGATVAEQNKEASIAEQIPAMMDVLAAYADLPQTTLYMWYAGLMKYHGRGRSGDGTVTSLEDAQYLLEDFFTEQESVEDGITDFYSLLNMLIEQMRADGFFDRIGLSEIMNAGAASQKNSTAKRKRVTEKP